jgi:choline-sulfatase
MDRYTRQRAVEFLSSYRGDSPYCLVADFNNPHNICGWVGENAGRLPLREVFAGLPPPPDNLYLSEDELACRPLPIQYLPSAHRRQAQAAGWDELKIRHYLHAYHHYLSLVDAEIGHVLRALRQRDDEADTLVVFFADHGDSMGGRWMVTKHTSFYEETMHVPLAFSGAGLGAGTMGGLCTLLDLLPTLCDFAGAVIPAGVQGRSLYADLTAGISLASVPEAVFAQWHTEWGYTVEPGRMVRTERYKYTHYLEDNREELYDLRNDPGEMRNLALLPEMAAELARHRWLLEDYLVATGDPYRSLKPVVDPMFRAAKASFREYGGPVAPDYYEQAASTVKP